MTEVCVQIFADFEEIKNAILAQGYIPVESYDNYDTYFSSLPKEKIKAVTYKELLDSSLIVRNIRGEKVNVKNIVYKKKTLDKDGNVINEVKTKLEIDDPEKAKAIFAGMGLCCWCDYKNCNNEFKKGEIIVNLQHVDELGNFIEIEEFESIKNKTADEKFSILCEIIKSLGFPIGADFSCKKPYMFLNK